MHHNLVFRVRERADPERMRVVEKSVPHFDSMQKAPNPKLR